MTNGPAARSDRPSVSTDPETGRTVDRLTDSEYHDVHAYYDKSPWSPSGNRLVFSSAEPEEIIDVRNPSRRTERFYKSGGGHGYTDEGALYLMNADGRNKELLVDDAVFTTHTGCVPTWIPERGTIAYGENRHGFGGEWRLYLVDLETDERVALTDLFPRMVHPEGETMLCQSSRGVVVLDLDTLDQEVVLTEEELFEASPHDSSEFYDPRVANLKWSPDGSEFILRIRAAGRKIKELYLVDADGSNLRRVTAASTSFHHHSWHPDGERLLYGDRNQDDEPRLYFTPEDALDEKELISEEPLGGHPSVNPTDHSKIVTDSYGGKFGEGVLLVDADTGEVEKLASLPTTSNHSHTGFHAHPVWNRDGTRILYNSDRTGTCNIYSLSLE